MMYSVVRHFTDRLDNKHKYTEGDVYPREGYTPSEDRIKELSTAANKQRTILIEPIPEAETAAEVAAEVAAEDMAEDVPDTNVEKIASEPEAEAELENEETEDKPKKRRKRDE